VFVGDGTVAVVAESNGVAAYLLTYTMVQDGVVHAVMVRYTLLPTKLLHMVRHPHCAFINYNWINQLSNTTVWWLDICCLLHRYQLRVSALMAIFRLID